MKRILIIVLLLLSACSNGSSSSELIALENLKNNPSEDLFMLNDRVYVKTDEILEPGQLETTKVDEITDVYNGNKRFKNGMATNLDVGTVVYMSSESNTTDYLYIKSGDRFIMYIAEIEG